MLNTSPLQITDFSEIIDILFESENIFQGAGTAFSKASDMFGIIQADISISSPVHKTIKETVYVNQKADFTDISVQKFVYGKNEGITVCIEVKLDKSKNLSETELRNLSAFSKVIYTFVSKSKYESIIENAGTVDIRTGILTIDGFKRELYRLFKERKKDNYALIFMNVKDFKIINRRYGHDQGNQVMNIIIRKIKTFLDSDSFFAYLGGDNFLVCINKSYLAIFIKMISKFSVNVFSKNGSEEEYDLSFHAGIANLSEIKFDETISPEQLMSQSIENANIAMTMSKRNLSSSTIVYYDEKVRHMIMYEKEIESNMYKALENGEFIVCYQPKVNLNTYEMTGAEALVRWKRDGKLIPPMSFIPIFEKNGFVCQLDFYVLDAVCKKIKSWIEHDIEPVKISVNFSKLHTDNLHIVDDITDVVVKNGILPKYLEIEFTETSYTDNSVQIRDIIMKLKEFGIMVSMDDFGTGYSSLNMLKEMPIDVLKLDKSFLSADGNISKREKIIIKNVIRMAKELDIEVVSEGVETFEHVRFLQNLNCDMAQGYFFDKPLLENDYESRLRHTFYDVQAHEADIKNKN